MSERPKVGVASVVCHDEKFVMLKRQGAHGEGTWSVPGGHLEYGEEPEETARRETFEEIGCRATDLVFLGFTNDIFGGKDAGKHYITLWYGAMIHKNDKPAICEPDKAVDIGWFDVDSLPSPLFKPWERVIGTSIEQELRRYMNI